MCLIAVGVFVLEQDTGPSCSDTLTCTYSLRRRFPPIVRFSVCRASCTCYSVWCIWRQGATSAHSRLISDSDNTGPDCGVKPIFDSVLRAPQNTPQKHPGSKNDCLLNLNWDTLPGKFPSAHTAFTVMMHVCLCDYLCFITPTLPWDLQSILPTLV